MRFLIDADKPYSLERLFIAYGHVALHVRDAGLGGTPDAGIAKFARSEQLAISPLLPNRHGDRRLRA